MNTVETLLALDVNKIEMPSKEVTLKLGKLGGQEVTFTCNAVNPNKITAIQNRMLDKKGGLQNVAEARILTIIEGCPTFRDKQLMEHFNCPTPKELLNKLLLAGEIDTLSEEIEKLNGYGKAEEQVEEIKNL